MSDPNEVKASPATAQSNDDAPSGKRRALIQAGAAAAALGTLGFPSVHAKSNVTLRFLNNETSVDSNRALRVAGAEYERKFGTKVIIDSTPIDDTFPKIQASIKAGQPYDLATIGFIAHMIILANQGALIPVTEMTKKHQWGPQILFPIKGQVWWYPYDYNLAANYYRKDLYAEKGLKIPETWEQYVSNSRALTVVKDGNVDRGGCIFPIASNGASNWTSFAFLWAEGVRIMDKNWNVILDNAENSERVGRYLDMYAELYKTMPPNMNSASYAQLLGLFATDKVAHSAYSGRLVETIEARAPNLADKFGIFPYMDSKGNTKAVNNGYDGFVVLKSKQSEEAMKFLRWFIENHYINWLHTAPIHFQPPRLDIYDDKRWWAHPLIEKHAQTVKTMQSWITDKKMVINSIDSDGPTPDVRPAKVFESYAMPEMLQNKVSKGMSNADCVKTAADKIRQVITS
jgi:multiple sugar transport system substrate-binding protein